jgi:hypothetical protein
LEEPFNENFTRWNTNNKDYRQLIHDVPSLEVQVGEIFTAYNGIKMLDYQLPDSLAVYLLQHPAYKVIFLRRKNLLQAIVSVLIAKQTTLWKRWEMVKPLEEYYQNLQPLKVQDVQRRVAALKEHLDFFESIIDARPKDAVVKLTYEDLYLSEIPQQYRQITAIWSLLKIPLLAIERYQYYLRPEEVKINSAATYSFLQNAREIDKFCGNDVTGWLFE